MVSRRNYDRDSRDDRAPKMSAPVSEALDNDPYVFNMKHIYVIYSLTGDIHTRSLVHTNYIGIYYKKYVLFTVLLGTQT